MKALTVNEDISFERKQDPKASMGIGNKEARMVYWTGVKKILDAQDKGMYCVFIGEREGTTLRFCTDPKKVLEIYMNYAIEKVEEIIEEAYYGYREISILKIDGNVSMGIFNDEREPVASEGVEVLFFIHFSSLGKITSSLD